MWNPFKKKPLLSEEDRYFQIECFKWLLTHFGSDDFYKHAKLVLPSKEFFPDVISSNESAAQVTFNRVMKYAGMENWPVTLEPQEQDSNLQLAPILVIQNTDQSPLGAFSVGENNQVTITYNPDIVSDPSQMVATFAHEISHCLTGTAPEPPPGGWDNWEFATDIAATFLGFGVFQANSAFNFQQYTSADSIGWRTTGGGYLSEAEHSYALALFLRLKEKDPEIAIVHCGRNIRNYLKLALSEIDDSDIINELRKIEYRPTDSDSKELE